jgi:dipeptidyl aminopeptidase/acylaminoacyl peptidase
MSIVNRPHRRGCARALIALLVSCLPAVAATQAPPTGRALAIEDYYRVKTVSAPELSPDGRWVAFTIGTRVEETNGSTSEAWVVSADGGSPPRRVSPAGVNASALSWMPDGRLRFTGDGVAWLSDPRVPADSNVRDTVGRATIGWRRSPDGKWSAAVRNTPLTAIEPPPLSDFEKRHEERFKGVQFDWLNFQRDGGVFPVPNSRAPDVTPPQEIFLLPVGGGAERQLTTLGLRPAAMQWSRDGKTILFTADSGYRNERSYGRTDIWTVTLDGRVTRLTPASDYSYAGARYSPDGKYVLTTRDYPNDRVIAQRLDHGGPTDLVIIPAAGGGREIVLTADWDYLPSSPQWSPDGRYVYFTGGIGGTSHLFRVPVAGGPVQQITSGERRIGGLSFDSTFRRIAFTVGRFEAPSEIHSANIDGSGERQLTHVHDDFIKEVALGRSERLQFRSADGTQVEGWLLYPYGYRADAGPYPLIVSNHGGPHSAVGYGFDFKSQYFAANGYFVLQVNFRSSTGYGEKFLWGTWGAWGTKDGQDVIAGIDHVIARVPIDAHRVATIGHSYGGFMSNWLITQYPDRFAAAVVGAGISNWISDYGTADIAVTKETEFYGAPWQPEAREIMLRQSPLIYANRAKAATLFIHGEIDQRVPYEEAEQMYFALKKNGVPAKVIRYDDQPHSISGSWNIVHRMLNERRWLDQYLRGATVP